MFKALIFDCDGVLVDTEKDGHRVAFNRAFHKYGLDITWSEELYGELLQVAGGKERIKHYFERFGWIDGVKDKDQFVKNLHAEKTKQFKNIIALEDLPLRPGINQLVDEAIRLKVRLGVCSTSNEESVKGCVRLMGSRRFNHFDFILAGDVVKNKKPAPDIYLKALETTGLSPDECLVIEDSHIGLQAAKAAGMQCVVTKSWYTQNEDFSIADKVLSNLTNIHSESGQLLEALYQELLTN